MSALLTTFMIAGLIAPARRLARMAFLPATPAVPLPSSVAAAHGETSAIVTNAALTANMVMDNYAAHKRVEIRD